MSIVTEAALRRAEATPEEIREDILDRLASALCDAESLTAGDTTDAFEIVNRLLWDALRPTGQLKPRRGRITRRLRALVFQRDEYACVECGTPRDLVADHIIPVAKGGKTIPENLRTLCGRCNSSKRDR